MSTAAPIAAPFPASRHIGVQPVAVQPTDAAAPRTRLRITRRGRAVLAAVIALPLVLGTGAAVLNGGGAVATDTASTAEFSYVEVEAGESLWSLAETIAPQADPREVISAIVRLNGLPSADVQPGERLAIPFEYVG
jgi:LysM domain